MDDVGLMPMANVALIPMNNVALIPMADGKLIPMTYVALIPMVDMGLLLSLAQIRFSARSWQRDRTFPGEASRGSNLLLFCRNNFK